MSTMTRLFVTIGAVLLATTAVAQDAIEAEGLSGPAGRPYSPYANRAFPTEVYFGDTHVHTALSADAGGSGTRLLPRDAYRFARGEQVISNTGQPVKLARPLDFYMITDHTDGMGAITDIIGGAPNIMADEQGRYFHEAFNKGGNAAQQAAFELTASFSQGTVSPALNYQPGNPGYKRVWDDIVAAAEEFDNPGVFTTFIAFEWTSLVSGNNLHRNVIFRDNADRAGQMVPYTTTPPVGSPDPRDLWAWLQNYEDVTGGDVLAIPHNGNLSNGMMFALQDDFAGGAALDAEYAATRQKWERLYEATQNKGDGEAHPFLSPEDEFADFETWDYGNLDASVAKTTEMLPGEYARSGLLRGLMLEAELGANPFKFGLVGASDNHVGLTTSDNDNFFGKYAAYEPSPERSQHVSKRYADGSVALNSWQYITSGLTAVWAESNTRGALFDAMERREVYATTGPRMRVRLFGGRNFEESDVSGRDLALVGYSKGVPMGSDLPSGDGAPSFLVYALRDPIGANLDRIQIIKGWIDAEGTPREKVYDVAWSDGRAPGTDGKLPAVGNTVDLSIPSWTNTIGAPELGAVWSDPEFDPALSAFYYARVIEIPTPRWTAYDAVKFGLDLPDDVPLITQERAYTSPIWYTPG
ncbi:MAG: hypothetical protein VR71_04215 [Roseovarius sp. BRH_c41]|uniref:DUF3604 domain-containing protein n=1 Tax=Roseovarius sp. BRH_c41 TaxID=1629709 RepID=UPI0005F25FCF|nr:DUF3604 domain-containing protein [Roseovarius sp. BRH_c41]KJS44829.1 MAG: hypothetical protein VR71_04215 [Roseovarius sp. BRH_c41]